MSISDVEKKYNELKSKNFDFFLNLEVHSYKAEVEVYNDKEYLNTCIKYKIAQATTSSEWNIPLCVPILWKRYNCN